MATYEQPNFAEIADAIDVDVALIAKHENLFEAAALWYRLARKRPERIVPSKLSEKLDRIAKSARRLFSSLAVSGLDEAADGPGNIEILAALVLAGQPNEDPHHRSHTANRPLGGNHRRCCGCGFRRSRPGIPI
jgi:hypothetical protein